MGDYPYKPSQFLSRHSSCPFCGYVLSSKILVQLFKFLIGLTTKFRAVFMPVVSSLGGTKKGKIGLVKRMKGFGFLHVILSPKML